MHRVADEPRALTRVFICFGQSSRYGAAGTTYFSRMHGTPPIPQVPRGLRDPVDPPIDNQVSTRGHGTNSVAAYRTTCVVVPLPKT